MRFELLEMKHSDNKTCLTCFVITWKETQAAVVLKVIAASYSTIKKLCEYTEQSQSATEEEEEVEGLV